MKTSRKKLKLYKNKRKSPLLKTQNHLRKIRHRFKIKKNLLKTRKITIMNMNTKINLTLIEKRRLDFVPKNKKKSRFLLLIVISRVTFYLIINDYFRSDCFIPGQRPLGA